MPIRQHTCQSDGERCESCEAESAELSRVNAARLKLNDLRASRSSETANFHRYTITSEGASKGYFRLVEDSEGAWVTWAEVAASRSSAPTEAPWRPIETAPKDRLIIGALIHDGKVWRVHEMKHNGLAFYTSAGGSLPQMTHWTELPALASPSPAPPTEENDASR